MATRWNELTPQTIAGILFIVIGATFISYMLIVIGQKNLRPTVAGMYNYVQPVVACIVAICCGMESLNLIKAAAVVLIFTGVYLVTASKSRQDLENHDADKTRPKSLNGFERDKSGLHIGYYFVFLQTTL